jgi:hypothetical protein
MARKTVSPNFLIGPALVLLVGLTSAQTFAQEQRNGTSDLIGGDWYELTIERSGIKENLRGHLVQLTDDWIVLGFIRCEAHTVEVPWLGEMPYVGHLFRKDEIAMSKVYTGIPRKDAVVDKRVACSDPSDFKLLADKLPTLENGFSLCWVENNKRIENPGKFSDATHRKFQVTQPEEDTPQSPKQNDPAQPAAGKEIELKNVLFLRTQSQIETLEATMVRKQ